MGKQRRNSIILGTESNLGRNRQDDPGWRLLVKDQYACDHNMWAKMGRSKLLFCMKHIDKCES